MDRLRITTSKAVGILCVDLTFSDQTRRGIDVGQFIRLHPHPQYNKYPDESEFEKFSIDDRNIVCGCHPPMIADFLYLR